MADAIQALKIKIAALQARGDMTGDVEIANARRALLAAQAERASAPWRIASEVGSELRARLSALPGSSRAAARKLGISRERLTALRHGRGGEPQSVERSRWMAVLDGLLGGPQPASRR